MSTLWGGILIQSQHFISPMMPATWPPVSFFPLYFLNTILPRGRTSLVSCPAFLIFSSYIMPHVLLFLIANKSKLAPHIQFTIFHFINQVWLLLQILMSTSITFCFLLQYVRMELSEYSGLMMSQARALSKIFFNSARIILSYYFLMLEYEIVGVLQNSEDQLARWGTSYSYCFLTRGIISCCGSASTFRLISLHVCGCWCSSSWRKQTAGQAFPPWDKVGTP